MYTVQQTRTFSDHVATSRAQQLCYANYRSHATNFTLLVRQKRRHKKWDVRAATNRSQSMDSGSNIKPRENSDRWTDDNISAKLPLT